jgi:hypothetical protein
LDSVSRNQCEDETASAPIMKSGECLGREQMNGTASTEPNQFQTKLKSRPWPVLSEGTHHELVTSQMVTPSSRSKGNTSSPGAIWNTDGSKRSKEKFERRKTEKPNERLQAREQVKSVGDFTRAKTGPDSQYPARK